MDHTRRTALLSAAALCLVLGGLFWLAVREDTPVPAAAPAAVAASTDNWGHRPVPGPIRRLLCGGHDPEGPLPHL